MSGDRARLFIALELPEEVRDALLEWRAAALAPEPRLRPIPGQYLHLTLCFLGWQAVGEVEAIGNACRQAVARDPGGELALGEPIWLPPRRPRVLAVKLTDLDGAAARVQSALSHALETGGWYRPEKRRFLPHVTVARVGSGSASGSRPLAPPPVLRFQGSRLTLYRSHLARTGARYEALAGIGLEPG